MVADGIFDGAPTKSLLGDAGEHHQHADDQSDDVDERRIAGEHVHGTSFTPARRSHARLDTDLVADLPQRSESVATTDVTPGAVDDDAYRNDRRSSPTSGKR